MVQAIGLTAADTAEVLVAAAPGAAFLQGEALEFTLKQPVVPPVEWTLRNWRNEVLRRESSNGGKLLLPPLPNGYYRLELSGFTGSRSFAVVPDPGNRPADPDLFFALDSAQSWLARPDNNSFDTMFITISPFRVNGSLSVPFVNTIAASGKKSSKHCQKNVKRSHLSPRSRCDPGGDRSERFG